MNKTRVFLIVQSALCVILAVLLAGAAIGICREGLVLKTTDPLSLIYTREKAAAALRPVLPLLALSLVMTGVGLLSGIRDENGAKPIKDTECPRDLMVRRVIAESTGMKAERKKEEKRALAGRTHLLRIALLVLAAALIIAGVFNGSAMDVFGKAIKICTECVGLG